MPVCYKKRDNSVYAIETGGNALKSNYQTSEHLDGSDGQVNISVASEAKQPEDRDEQIVISIENRHVNFREKLTNTVFLFWNMATVGMAFGQIGPVLPDLQFITGSSLEQASWLLTGFGVGYIAGCLLAGIVLEKVNYRLLQFVSTLGTAAMTATLPWIRNIYLAIAIRIFQGTFLGGQDIVNHATTFAIWSQNSGPYFLMLYTVYAAGGIMSPLYSKPFLLTSQSNFEEHGQTVNSSTSIPVTVSSYSATFQEHEYVETNVKYAFLITAVLTLSAGLPFLIMYIFNSNDPATLSSVTHIKQKAFNLSQRLKYSIVVVMLVESFITTSCIVMFPGLLATFVIRQLRWTQQSAAVLTAVFYATYCFGNLIGMLILKFSTTNNLITVSYAVTIASLAGFLIGSITSQPLIIWIAVTVNGLSMAAIVPTIYTWTEENVTHVTGRIASGLLISGSLGMVFQPMLLGFLMDNHSHMWFIYFTLGGTVVCAILYAISFILVKLFGSAN